MEHKGLLMFSTEGDIHTNWRLFKRKFLTYIDAYHVDATDKQKIGILLHHGGDYCQDVYEAFEIKIDKLDKVIEKFDSHFIPKSNVTYERYKIFTIKQEPEEPFEMFATALKRMSQSCNFGNIQDELVRDLFICGINNTSLQQQLLGMKDVTLEKAITVCRNYSIVESQVEDMEKVSEQKIKTELDVDVLQHKSGKWNYKKRNDCKYCGYKHEYGKCPAYGKICAVCKKKNHFAKMCKSKKVNLLEEGSDESDIDYNIAILSLEKNRGYSWYCANLIINNVTVTFKIDSGAQCNVLSKGQFTKLHLSNIKLESTKVVITSFSNGKVPIIDKCSLKCTHQNFEYVLQFYVVDSDCYNILGLESSELLGFIKRVNTINTSYIVDSYQDLFDGNVGCVPHIVHLQVDNNIKPVVSPARRIPYSLMPKVKKELDNLVQKKIIAPVTEPTDWVSQMVIVQKKDGSLRICLDPRIVIVQMK